MNSFSLPEEKLIARAVRFGMAAKHRLRDAAAGSKAAVAVYGRRFAFGAAGAIEAQGVTKSAPRGRRRKDDEQESGEEGAGKGSSHKHAIQHRPRQG